MANFSSIENFDWFDSAQDGVVYVKYLNADAIEILSTIDADVAFTAYRDFNPQKYVQILDTAAP